MKAIRPCMMALMLIAILLAGCVSAGTTNVDEIKDYKVDVWALPDGHLKIVYAINWCVVSDAEGDLTYITVGVPNRSFTIESYDGEFIKSIKDASESDWSGVRIDMNRPFKVGECFTVGFTINQGQMLNFTDGNPCYKFVPGWFDEVPIDHLMVRWVGRPEQTVTSSAPRPRQEEDVLIWEASNIAPGSKYTVELIYRQGSFPDWKDEKAPGMPLWLIIVIIIVALIILVGLQMLDDEYGGSSGGGGLSLGGGSSCACACACAGGGRVGCGKRGFLLARLCKQLPPDC